ncbi:helix-turn-helix domain-containing protein [Candidatus Harpocratesius sp.]
MTKKGEQIQSQILRFLERNPDGLRIGQLTELLGVSRNSVYRYLDILVENDLVRKQSNKLWVLTTPLKPQTILGYQYQALLQGLCHIGGNLWDIKTEIGRSNFKELGKWISPRMKESTKLDLEELKQKTHFLQDILEFGMKLVDEASSVEQFTTSFSLDANGFPNENTNLAAVVSFQGGYVQTSKVQGNGFAHYYIIAGIIERSMEQIIPAIYGGRVYVDILNMDEENQHVELGLYVIFDKITPFIDPYTKRRIPFPQREIRLHGHY